MIPNTIKCFIFLFTLFLASNNLDAQTTLRFTRFNMESKSSLALKGAQGKDANGRTVVKAFYYYNVNGLVNNQINEEPITVSFAADDFTRNLIDQQTLKCLFNMSNIGKGVSFVELKLSIAGSGPNWNIITPSQVLNCSFDNKL
jgi:hypothetical protein